MSAECKCGDIVNGWTDNAGDYHPPVLSVLFQAHVNTAWKDLSSVVEYTKVMMAKFGANPVQRNKQTGRAVWCGADEMKSVKFRDFFWKLMDAGIE